MAGHSGEPLLNLAAASLAIIAVLGRPFAAIEEVEPGGAAGVCMSEIDDHAVIGCVVYGVGEPGQHGSRHAGEYDPLSSEFRQVRAQRLVVSPVPPRDRRLHIQWQAALAFLAFFEAGLLDRVRAHSD